MFAPGAFSLETSARSQDGYWAQGRRLNSAARAGIAGSFAPAAHETKRLAGNGGICVFVKDVDLVYVDLASRGANVIKAPQNYDYGMRDFDVVDLDGNHLTFGMESPSTS